MKNTVFSSLTLITRSYLRVNSRFPQRRRRMCVFTHTSRPPSVYKLRTRDAAASRSANTSTAFPPRLKAPGPRSHGPHAGFRPATAAYVKGNRPRTRSHHFNALALAAASSAPLAGRTHGLRLISGGAHHNTAAPPNGETNGSVFCHETKADV